MQPTHEDLVTDAPDPFELPDTIQLASVEDPYPFLAAARRVAPVTWDWPLGSDINGEIVELPPDAPRSLNVLGHDAVTTVLRDHERYSSTVLAEVMGPVLDGALIALDEPEHRAHRALVAPAFRPRVLERWQNDLVERVVDELLDDIAPRGRADLVRALTFAFPVRVIAAILGLPDSDCAQFQRWSVEIINTIVNWDRGIAATHALDEYFTEHIAARRAHLADDLVSDLIQIEVDGEHLSDDDIRAFVRLLLPAGIETTYRSFGNLLFALLTHPEQLAEVRASGELHIQAIEEALRWETPLILIPRRCVRDATLEGVPVPAGTDLNVFLGSANRDETRYPSADCFDVHRSPTPHVSFGSGPHACLGMHLARMESRVALRAVLERLPNLRLDDDAPPARMVGALFRSPASLPVRFG
jgi:cytochrome P450